VKEALKVGPLTLWSRIGLLVDDVQSGQRLEGVTYQLGRETDSIVAFDGVCEGSASPLRSRLASGVALGSIQFAMNFDPPEDHPVGFDFSWVSALIADFRVINDDICTVEGLHGDHFNTLLAWQPRVDPAVTALLAWVQLSPRVENEAGPLLAEIFETNRYDGIILSGDREETVAAFATEMHRGTHLPLMIAQPEEERTLVLPFSMQFWVCSPSQIVRRAEHGFLPGKAERE